MKVALHVLLGSLLVLTCGCRAEKPWHDKTTVGSLTRDEVASLKKKIAEMTFPAPRGSVELLLPAGMIPDHVSIYEANGPVDTMPLDTDGCGGGQVLDYWLNSDYVLRLAIGYYPRSVVFYKDAWAAIIRSKDRETFRRTPYKSAEPNQFPQPPRPTGG